jgi:UDP-glucose 4-epimerase
LILATGGTGYVGSHACKLLARAGEEVVAFEKLRFSDLETIITTFWNFLERFQNKNG